MSTLLKDAIVDAKALREAALKNAETTVIDKYSEEVRQTLNQLLEQEEELGALGGAGLEAPLAEPPAEETGTGEVVAEDIPLAATDDLSSQEGENLSGLPESGETVDVEINLDALQEAVQALQDEQEYDLNEEALAALLEDSDSSTDPLGTQEASEIANPAKEGGDDGSAEEATAAGVETETDQFNKSDDGGEGPTTKESLEISEELIDSIVERLTVDMGADLTGWAGSSTEAMRYQMEKEFARRRSTDVEDNMKDLKKAQEEVVFENNQLKQSLEQHKNALMELKESMYDVNLSNARLLYTNRVLRNTSLNERQKSKVVDAISKAGSVTEAKTIYRTLESTVESAPQRGPQSLSEAIGRQRTSVIRASRKESTPSDPVAERMKKLAGIE